MGVEFRMKVTEETEEISTKVKNLQIASAIFNERDKQRVKVCNTIYIKTVIAIYINIASVDIPVLSV